MNPAIQPLRFLMQWVLKQWFHCRTNTEVLEQPGMPPQGTDWNYDKNTFRAPESFFSRGLNAPLIFLFFSLWWEQKNFLEPEKFFFHSFAHAFESNFLPTSFSEFNYFTSLKLKKIKPRTSSALALNYAEKNSPGRRKKKNPVKIGYPWTMGFHWCFFTMNFCEKNQELDHRLRSTPSRTQIARHLMARTALRAALNSSSATKCSFAWHPERFWLATSEGQWFPAIGTCHHHSASQEILQGQGLLRTSIVSIFWWRRMNITHTFLLSNPYENGFFRQPSPKDWDFQPLTDGT